RESNRRLRSQEIMHAVRDNLEEPGLQERRFTDQQRASINLHAADPQSGRFGAPEACGVQHEQDGEESLPAPPGTWPFRQRKRGPEKPADVVLAQNDRKTSGNAMRPESPMLMAVRHERIRA